MEIDIKSTEGMIRFALVQSGDINADFSLEAYKKKILRQAKMVHEYLPNEGSIVDIGSGIGGVDLVLLMSGCDREFFLVDGDSRYAHTLEKKQPTFYSNKYVTEEFFRLNGVGERMTYILPEELNNIPDKSVGLFVSFAAWPFHIKTYEYLNFVRRTALPGATVAVECRIGSNQEETISKSFTKWSSYNISYKKRWCVFKVGSTV